VSDIPLETQDLIWQFALFPRVVLAAYDCLESTAIFWHLHQQRGNCRRHVPLKTLDSGALLTEFQHANTSLRQIVSALYCSAETHLEHEADQSSTTMLALPTYTSEACQIADNVDIHLDLAKIILAKLQANLCKPTMRKSIKSIRSWQSSSREVSCRTESNGRGTTPTQSTTLCRCYATALWLSKLSTTPTRRSQVLRIDYLPG
jgi:hypothetical protein